MYLGSILWLLAASCASAERWSWPGEDSAAEPSVRIDNKVRFIDNEQRNTKRNSAIQADEIPFREPTNTEGFYNQPAGAGRYPVRVEQGDGSIRINGQTVYLNSNSELDGTLDSLQHCKCVTRPDCNVQTDYGKACGTNQFLCCYNQPGNQNYPSEYFNEVGDERPMLFPNTINAAGPFPPPPGNNGIFRPSFGSNRQPAVLVGPGGPTGNIGPQNSQVLVGPGGPTGLVGPERPVTGGPQGPSEVNSNHKNVLVGPGGPTGEIGPSESAQRGVLVGPGGPTGIIGPGNNRPVLVGPGGPTGIIGPRRQGVLVGPGGPTGVIGPNRFHRPAQRPGILVGPGGPTGVIGPGRQILVGPGGPTGQIGPRNYFL